MKSLRIHKISKITHHKVLDNVNLTIKPGETHAIIGNNGEGKSMLAKILAGAVQKSSGSIYLDDQEVLINNIQAAKKLGIFMVQQDIQLFPSLSIRDNLVLGNENTIFNSRFMKPGRKIIDHYCEEILEHFGLQLNLDEPISNLSLGEMQLIQLIRVIICKPSILILDEFSSTLTFKETEKVFYILEKLKAENVAIILITHSFYEILHYCDRVSIMSEGTITATYTNSKNGFCDQSFLEHMRTLSMDFKYPKLVPHPGSRLLEVDHISVGNLKDINLTLHEGEILGIAGLAGSGRSTLMKVITGQLKPQSGSIHFEAPLTQNSISLVPENSADASLFYDCSIPFNIVASNMKKTKENFFISNNKSNRYARNYTDKLNIRDTDIYDKINHLSIGNKQKVVIARSLFNRSKIYIFDEASKNLDPASKLELYNIFNALILEGAAILLISSDFSELIGMCNRIILLSNGVQIGNYSTDNLTLDTLYEKL